MCNILIVEDDRAMQQIFTEVLKIDGHHTLSALDGEKAIELLSSHQPDILILDMYLPKLSGYDILRYIQESGMYDHMKIIIVTANNNIMSCDEAELVDVVMLKPISMPQLRQMVGRLVSVKSA